MRNEIEETFDLLIAAGVPVQAPVTSQVTKGATIYVTGDLSLDIDMLDPDKATELAGVEDNAELRAFNEDNPHGPYLWTVCRAGQPADQFVHEEYLDRRDAVARVQEILEARA